VPDLNGDGKPDVVISAPSYPANPGTTTGLVEVLIGNGDGTFQTPVAYRSGGSETDSLALADVNGDGKPDIVVSYDCLSV
jgi:hypothetical protein